MLSIEASSWEAVMQAEDLREPSANGGKSMASLDVVARPVISLGRAMRIRRPVSDAGGAVGGNNS
jgi:hypothetical protein